MHSRQACERNTKQPGLRPFLKKQAMSFAKRYLTRPRIRSFSSKSIPRLLCGEEDARQQLTPQIASYYQKQHPVIFPMSKDTPALHKWVDWDYLSSKIDINWVGEVEMGAYNQGQRITIPFSEYMEYLKLWKQQQEEDENQIIPQEHILYMAQNDLLIELHDDIRLPSIEFAENKWYNIHWWVGPRNTNSPLHFDPLDNYLMQVVGRKSVVLFNKNHDAASLYAGSRWGQQENTSAANVFDLDRMQFPDLDLQQSYQAILEPGDVLYIPAKWWHAVTSVDFSISVNAWWR